MLRIVFLLTISTSVWSNLPTGISWNTKSVEAAMSLAKKQNKPLFLYWGAVWCPPCNYIKKNIFTTEIFKTEIKNFIPVYLDGDSNEAQTWGDKLKTRGYPTMLILDPSGAEVMRLPVGVSANEYVMMMQESRKSSATIKVRMDKARAGLASEKDWESLAGHSWEQEPELKLEGLYLKVPAHLKILKSRLLIQEILGEEKITSVEKDFLEIIQDPSLIEANIMSFIDYTPKLMAVVFLENKEEKSKAAKLFTNTIESMLQKKDLILHHRVGLYFPLITMDEIILGKIAELTLKKVKAVATLASVKASGAFERQSVMSSVVDLLIKAGDYTQAKELALKELKISKSPFYFMSSLAEIAKLAGNNLESIAWSKKAWLTATGANTRFQWGVNYVAELVETNPEIFPAIKADTLAVVNVGLNNQEAFQGRNQMRFEKLAKKLKKWGSTDAHTTTYSEMKQAFSTLCQKKRKIADSCFAWLKTL